MKNFIIFFIISLVLVGCSRDTDLIIHNKTNHKVFYTLNNGEKITLEGNKTDSHHYKLGKKYLLNEPEKVVKIEIEGQTYELPFGYSATEITLSPERDYTIFLWPTHSVLKIYNNSDLSIYSVKHIRNHPTHIEVSNNLLYPGERVNNGDYFWFRIPSNDSNAPENRKFYYTFELQDIYENTYIFGGPDLKMMKDDSYVIELVNEEDE